MLGWVLIIIGVVFVVAVWFCRRWLEKNLPFIDG